MRVTLPIRWIEKKNVDPGEALLNKLINGEEPQITEGTFVYGKINLDTEDIYTFNDFDDAHAIMRMKSGEFYVIAIPFDELEKIYTEITGKIVTKVEKKIVKEKKAKRKDEDVSKDDDMLLP